MFGFQRGNFSSFFNRASTPHCFYRLSLPNIGLLPKRRFPEVGVIGENRQGREKQIPKVSSGGLFVVLVFRKHSPTKDHKGKETSTYYGEK